MSRGFVMAVLSLIVLGSVGAIRSFGDDDLTIAPVAPIDPVGKIDDVGPIDPVGSIDMSDGYQSQQPDDGECAIFSLPQPADKTADWTIDDNEGKLYPKSTGDALALKKKTKDGIDALAYCIKVDPNKWKKEKDAVTKRIKNKLNDPKVRLRWVTAAWIDPTLSKPGKPVAMLESTTPEEAKKKLEPSWDRYVKAADAWKPNAIPEIEKSLVNTTWGGSYEGPVPGGKRGGGPAQFWFDDKGMFRAVVSNDQSTYTGTWKVDETGKITVQYKDRSGETIVIRCKRNGNKLAGESEWPLGTCEWALDKDKKRL